MAQVHLIGNAHLDPVWLWRYNEGYAEVLATFRSALDRIDEFPDFVFTCAGAAYYAWVERTAPEMFERIRRAVAQGRWVIVGGWWIQPDCNAPCGESFARHALYSQRYYRSRFGTQARVGYNVDSFGHNGMLPQLLRQSGMDSYVFMRPGTHEKDWPHDAFMWQGADGTRVPTFRIPGSYGNWGFGGAADKARDHMERAEKAGHPYMCFYGVGNHGGGPTIRNVSELSALIAEEGRGKYALSSPNAYFDELDADALPVLTGDLQHHASGCYTAVMAVKAMNRQAESRLMAAERMGVVAETLLGLAPGGLENAWRDVLFNQFHDIMGGCSIREAYDDALAALASSVHAGETALNDALQALAWNIDTMGDAAIRNSKDRDFRLWAREGRGVPVTIFNPHAYEITAPATPGAVVAAVTDETGAPQRIQTVRASQSNGDRDKYETRFMATLPPLGWRTYWCYLDAGAPVPPAPGMLEAGASHLENDALRVEVDPRTGQISRLYDKRAKRELLRGRASARVLDEEHCDTWAHAVFKFDKAVGEFEEGGVMLMECGALCATLCATSRFGASTLRQYITLYRESREVEIRCLVHWHEAHRMLKLCYPTPLTDARVLASIPYGFLPKQQNGEEEPMQQWVTLEQGERSFSVLTDTRAAYDALDGELRVTALRSPLYADHFAVRDAWRDYTDQGEHRFALQLCFDAPQHALSRLAAPMLLPPQRITGSYHEGKLPQAYSFLSCEGDAARIDISTLKRAEDGEGYVLRCHETGGDKANGTICIPALGVTAQLALDAQQITTLRVAGGQARESNLLED